MITSVIFDLDGLLADTERLHRQAYREVLAPLGIVLDDAKYVEHWIRLGRGIADLLREMGSAVDPAIVRRGKAARYRELVRSSVRPMPGVPAVFLRLRGRKRMALASSSYPDAVACVIDTLGIRAYFESISAHDDVAKVKPAPDLFLHAAASLRVKPAACVVLEDAEKGILAAVRAGMKCIAVPNEYTRHNDFSGASRVVESLDEVTIELIESLG